MNITNNTVKNLFVLSVLCLSKIAEEEMQISAYSKINLSLNVVGKQGKFHNIDSVVVTVDCCDTVSVTLRKDSNVVVRGCENIPMETNSAYKMACAFVKTFGTKGCDINIVKNIPIGAGMGGSSADAAAVARCLCLLNGIDIGSAKVKSLCAQIGSDINFLLVGGYARITGKGDDVSLFNMAKPLYFAVTTFDQQMLAKDVYNAFDTVGGCDICDNDKLVALLQKGDFSSLNMLGNNLQNGALSLSNYAQDYLNFCSVHKLNCHMTGSGSAFYVAFDNEQSAKDAQTLLNNAKFNTFVCKSVKGYE